MVIAVPHRPPETATTVAVPHPDRSLAEKVSDAVANGDDRQGRIVRPKAPAIAGQDWLTTDPVEPAAKNGRPSILLFWSIGCEASWTQLQELHDRMSGLDVALVAVHSPRFAYERDPATVAAAVAREQMPVPVVHDPELLTWARYDPGGWPAAVLIDHRGRAIGASFGVGELETLAESARMASEDAKKARRRGKIASPIEEPSPGLPPLANKRDLDTRPMLWPSSTAVVGPRHLAVVDSGRSRLLIIETAPDFTKGRVIGQVEDLDRVRQVCRWTQRGLAVSLPGKGQVLGIDVVNEISKKRKLRFERRVVANGLTRPQGLTVDRDGSLVITDAGADQLLRCSTDGVTGVIAGSGYTGSKDGRADTCELAQPVAVTRGPAGLVFLDTATSNVRLLRDNGTVHTVTGNGYTNFGLVDGPAHRAVLQRPTSVVSEAGKSLWIADTGNSRVRCLADSRLTTLGLAGLRHPEDVAVLPTGQLLIADTGNHRLIVTNPTDRSAHELVVE